MLRPLRYFYLTLLHYFSKSRLLRKPETFSISDQEQQAQDYDRAVDTVMMLPYILALDIAYRALEKTEAIAALDLCCGPGHFTRLLAKTLDCNHVMGVDLSDPALENARRRAQNEGLPQLKYLNSDVTFLWKIPSQSMDLVSFMNGAHHLNSLEDVKKTLLEADRVAKPDGLIIVMDPVRPKTARLAETYHHIGGEDYLKKGLFYFNHDFHESLYASWTMDEFKQIQLFESERKWVQLVPFGYPSFQIIIGLPKNREKLFLRKGLSAQIIEKLIPAGVKADWKMLSLSFRLAKQRIMKPISRNDTRIGLDQNEKNTDMES